jgi:asparagine N-glycosylation enzyme membrane subunit Stt3
VADNSDEIDVKKIFHSIKKFFSGKDEETNSTMKKVVKALPYILVIAVFMFSVFLRTESARLSGTEDWARSSLNQQIRQQISSSIDQQFPNLPPQNRDALLNEQINDYISQNQEQYNQQVDEISTYFKSRLQTDDGQTYLLAIDPYNWLYLAEDVVDHGYPGDEIRDGKPWDTLRQAPYGDPAGNEAHIWVVAYVHKFLRFFNPDQDLIASSFYIPVFLASLAVIPAFFIAKKFGGNLGGTISAMIVAIHPSFMARTMGGFSDTDPYNVTLPLFVVWFIIEAFMSKDLKKALLFSGLSVLAITLFAISWTGWWYIYLVVVASIFIYAAWLIYINTAKKKKSFISIFKQKSVKKDFSVIGSFLVGSVLLIGLIKGFHVIKAVFWDSPMSIVNIKEVAQTTVWPNVLTTVAELNAASHSQIISSLGGKAIFIVAMLGILMTLFVRGKENWAREGVYAGLALVFYMVILNNPDAVGDFVFVVLLALPIFGKMIFNLFVYDEKTLSEKIDIKYASLVLIWAAATIFSSTRGVRFVMLAMPAFALGVGVAAGTLMRVITRYFTETLGVNKRIITPVIAIILFFVFVTSPVSGNLYERGRATSLQQVPSMNDAWYSTLKGIDADAPKDAIIGSWWDFGHWFKAIANRSVYFDGASQTAKAAHWIGNALLTSNETVALGGMRMLACGRDDAYNLLEAEFGPVNAVATLNDLFGLSRADARVYLTDKELDTDTIESVVDATLCEPPAVYFITSEDMVGKAGVWGHFGSWDFRRAEIYNRVNNLPPAQGVELLMSDYGYSDEQAQSLYNEIVIADPNQWISPWPGYLGSGTGCAKRDDLHLCLMSVQGGQLNLVFNATSKEAYILGQENAELRPRRISYVDESGRFIVKEYNPAQLQFGFTFIKNGENYAAVMMDPLQTGSMFTRMFFHNGAGVGHFEKFNDVRGITGGRIITWKVNWDSFISSLENGEIFIEETASLTNESETA